MQLVIVHIKLWYQNIEQNDATEMMRHPGTEWPMICWLIIYSYGFYVAVNKSSHVGCKGLGPQVESKGCDEDEQLYNN